MGTPPRTRSGAGPAYLRLTRGADPPEWFGYGVQAGSRATVAPPGCEKSRLRMTQARVVELLHFVHSEKLPVITQRPFLKARNS